MINEIIYNMAFAKVFPFLITKAEKKGLDARDTLSGQACGRACQGQTHGENFARMKPCFG